MNAVLGGDLYQDIKPFEHLPHNGHWAKVHTVTVRRGTLLSRILGQDTVLVNSQHHQAVDRVAPGFTLAALSEDGIVEAIEKPTQGSASASSGTRNGSAMQIPPCRACSMRS